MWKLFFKSGNVCIFTIYVQLQSNVNQVSVPILRLNTILVLYCQNPAGFCMLCWIKFTFDHQIIWFCQTASSCFDSPRSTWFLWFCALHLPSVFILSWVLVTQPWVCMLIHAFLLPPLICTVCLQSAASKLSLPVLSFAAACKFVTVMWLNSCTDWHEQVGVFQLCFDMQSLWPGVFSDW